MALRRRKKKVNIPEMGLNITSLMDVLTVLLFFLIKSMTVTSTSVTPPEGIRLPASVSDHQVEEAAVVAFTKNDIRLNHELVTPLNNGNLRPEDLGEDKRTILPLETVLKKEYAKKKRLYGSQASMDLPGKILIQADHKLPFDKLKYLLHTASVSGFTDYQFVVEKPKE